MTFGKYVKDTATQIAYVIGGMAIMYVGVLIMITGFSATSYWPIVGMLIIFAGLFVANYGKNKNKDYRKEKDETSI